MAKRGALRIGLSGWNYAGWKDSFYAGVKRADWLAHASHRFPTLEVNATFYREQQAKTLKRWRKETPEDFLFTVKGHRYITHSLHLKDAEDSVVRQRENARPLGDKLAAVVWQLPEAFRANHDRLKAFLNALGRWRKVHHAIELRHESWFTDETAALLEKGGIANCVSDAGRWPRWDAATAPLVYLRLHGQPDTYRSAYGRKGLERWRREIARWRNQGRDVLVYFDNDAELAAFDDAALLMDLCDGR